LLMVRRNTQRSGKGTIKGTLRRDLSGESLVR
jgi:hypothetical protein